MEPRLSPEDRHLLAGGDGPAAALAMRVVLDAARLLRAEQLIPIGSSHIDGCLYHGDGGVEFAERLVELGAEVRVPTTLNVGALDLLHGDRVRAEPERAAMARRLMDAYTAMGCAPTWTCAPYQIGHRPGVGEHVAWGESNAVVFANSVLGARTHRYGDFLDICCALTGRAPLAGMHRTENRRATVLVDLSRLSEKLRDLDAFYPVLGTWLGRAVDDRVAVIAGVPRHVGEDQLKALGAAAASTGAVALVHVAGVTPEAPDVETALGGHPPTVTLRPGPEDIREARDGLSTASGDRVDAVAVGSPHFSRSEFERLSALLPGRRLATPFYVCTGRGVLADVEAAGILGPLRSAGVTIVVDTCVVVTPVLPERGGTLMTDSGKFAHYTPSLIGYDVVFGSLEECVHSAEAGRVVRLGGDWA